MRIESFSDRRLLTGAAVILLLFLSPLFILGDNAHIRVHDNLDSNIAWYKVLADSGELTGSIDARIPQIMNGQLQRNAFGTEWSLIVWLHALFPTMAAYALSQGVARFVAFIGMYLLLKKHFVTEPKWGVIRVGTALAFALTPFWPSGMLSTLGMPLALWALLNIRQGERGWPNFLVLTLIPFYASIVLGFFFFLIAMGLLWLWDIARGRGWNWPFIGAIAYMAAVFMAVEYRLVYSFLFDQEPNSRDDYFHARLTFAEAVKLSIKNYFLGHTHVMTLHTLVIQPAMFAALLILIKAKRLKEEKRFVFLFILNIVLSIWYAFWFYKGWLPLTERFHFLDTFNFARFHFLRPLVIYLLFALSLKIIWESAGVWRRTVPWIAAAQIVVLLLANEEIVYRDKPSAGEFLAVEQFAEIRDYIGIPQKDYRVASIGFHPAVSQYNGFYTLDTYANFYPLSYKKEFRKIIARELDKNRHIRTYFDEWGGRCYLFTDELGKRYMFKKNTKQKLKNLDLDIEAFKDLGGTFIFSAVPIENAGENGLYLEKIFKSKTSAWKVHLYRVV